MIVYACRSTVSGIWVSRMTGQCPGSRLISQIVAMQRFLPRHPVGSGGHHLRWPLAQHGGERHWVPASESPVPEGVRQGPRRNVSPFSKVTKRQTTHLAPAPFTAEKGHTGPHTHTRAHAPVPPFTRALPGGPHTSLPLPNAHASVRTLQLRQRDQDRITMPFERVTPVADGQTK